MGVPAVLMAIGGSRAVKDIGMNLVAAAASSAASSLLVGLGRETTYAGNRAGPNVRPPVEMLIDLYNRDWIDKQVLYELARDQGVHIGHDAGPESADRIWNVILQASQFEIGVNEAISLRRLDHINQEQYRQILTNNGIFYNSKVGLLEKLSDTIPVAMIVSLLRQGSIRTEADARYWMKAAGITDSRVQDGYLDASQPIGPADAFRLLQMGTIEFAAYDQVVSQAGYIEGDDKQQLWESLHNSPSASDLVTFAVREVWDANVVRRFGFDEEFDSIPEFRWWMKVAGMGGDPRVKPNDSNRVEKRDADGNVIQTTVAGYLPSDLDSWAKAYWRAHWQLPSPTQGYEFLHRLRPNRIERYRQLVPDVSPFTFVDMQLLLKTADYPKPFRDRLAAVSFRTVTRVDLRRLYDLDVINAADVYEYNLDYGYVPEDARRLTEYIVKDRSKRRLGKAKQKEVDRQIRIWKMGVLDDATLVNRLADLGISATEAKLTLATAKADIAEQRIALAQKNVKNQYVQWDIDEQRAKELLRGIGMVQSAVESFVATWKLEREGKGRHVTASQIARWVVRGVLSRGNAVKRLIAMGYERTDAIRIVLVAVQDENVANARAAKAAATTQKQAKRAAEAEIRALEQQTARLRRRLAVGGSPGQLKRWLKRDLVSPAEVYKRLVDLGWQPIDANRFVVDVTNEDAPQFAENRNEQLQPEREQ